MGRNPTPNDLRKNHNIAKAASRTAPAMPPLTARPAAELPDEVAEAEELVAVLDPLASTIATVVAGTAVV